MCGAVGRSGPASFSREGASTLGMCKKKKSILLLEELTYVVQLRNGPERGVFVWLLGGGNSARNWRERESLISFPDPTSRRHRPRLWQCWGKASGFLHKKRGRGRRDDQITPSSSLDLVFSPPPPPSPLCCVRLIPSLPFFPSSPLSFLVPRWAAGQFLSFFLSFLYSRLLPRLRHQVSVAK